MSDECVAFETPWAVELFWSPLRVLLLFIAVAHGMVRVSVATRGLEFKAPVFG